MEKEVLETVLTELLEELKRINLLVEVDAPVRLTISRRGQLTTLFAGEDLRHTQILV